MVTDAVLPLTTPMPFSPGKGGVIRVRFKVEPVCTMELTTTVPPLFVLHVPEKSAGDEDEPSPPPPPPHAAIIRPQQIAKITFIAFMSFL